MSLSDYYENKILDHLVGNASFTMLTTMYIALSTATIDDTTTGTTIVEPVGNGYACKQMTANPTLTLPNCWGAAAAGSITTIAVQTFPENTAGGNWGTITDFALVDAATLGNILAYGTLTSPQAVVVGDTLQFNIGAITVILA